MTNYGKDTRQWLLSAIKQRKLLLLRKESHKSQFAIEIALKMLEDLLSSYSYENPLYMARFINRYADDISTILPGKGSTCHEKKRREFDEIRREATRIELGKEEAQSTGLRAQGKNSLFASRCFPQGGKGNPVLRISF